MASERIKPHITSICGVWMCHWCGTITPGYTPEDAYRRMQAMFRVE